MFRPKTSVYLLASMVLAVAALSACSSPNASEENLVRQFFRASGLRDNQTLANFATVSFEPKTEGTVTDFEVTAVSPERTEPLRVIELSKAVTEAEAANKAFNEKKKTYQDANIEAIDRVLKAESAGRKLAGKDAQIQAEWTKWRDESGAEAKKLSAARAALSDARPIAELSLHGQLRRADADGRRAQRHARVEGHHGEAPRSRAPTARRAEKNLRDDGAARGREERRSGERQGKWIITGVKPA